MGTGSDRHGPIAATTPEDDRFEKSMVECERLCNDFDRAAYQLVRYYGATLEGLREQLEEAVKDA